MSSSAPRPATAGSPASVRAQGWGWRFHGRTIPAVVDLDLSIAPGERVLLLGASGSGKSTLLAGLAGVLGDDQGVVTGSLTVDGVPPVDARGRVGLVLQDPENQVILERVGDDVAFGCENLGIPAEQIWPRVHSALDAVGLHLPLNHSTSHLSGGQKQRLALAGVLAMQPGLVLLDEPTANLDPAGVREVRESVENLADVSGATVVIVEHRVDTWWDFATRVIVIALDGVLWDGAPTAIPASVASSLTDAGIWLPSTLPPTIAAAQPGDVLLAASELRSSYASAFTPEAPSSQVLNMDARAGSIVAVTGPNGVGKSATALTLAGLLKPAAGSVEATGALLRASAGTPRNPHPIRWRSKELLPRIGMVFQAPEHQFVSATVRKELAVGPRALRQTAKQVAQRVDELLHHLALEDLAQAHPFTLSGGQQRRLSVATALATRPRVLVVDEPTFGQDARTWASMVKLLAELRNDGTAILAVTHDERFVASVADTVIELSRTGESAHA
jgi:energy-coupling factor transporter ATP-binding protein EcfA2